MGAKLGMSAKVYCLAVGNRASWGVLNTSTGVYQRGAAPSNLNEISDVRDVSMNLEKAEADASTRGNNGWRARLGALKDGGVEFGTVYDTENDEFEALLSAWLNGTAVALLVLDDAKTTTGAQGLWADFEITNISKTENLEEAQLCTITAKPTYSSIPPQWVKITGDVTAPTLSARTVPSAGTTLTATISESGCTPASGSGTGGFTLAGTSATVASWAIVGTTLTLTLSGTVTSGQTVTLSYGGSAGIKDTSNNLLATFSGASVTNNSTA
jgi:hypothetical protein